MDLNKEWLPSDDETHGAEEEIIVGGHSLDLNELPADEETGPTVHQHPENQDDEIEVTGHSFDLNELPAETVTNVHQYPDNQHDTQLNDSSSNEEAANTNGQATHHGPIHHRRLQLRLSSEDKMNVLIFLLQYQQGDDLKKGAKKAAMEHFNLKRKCVTSIWTEAKRQKQLYGKYKPCTHYHLAGRKRVTIPEEDISKLGMGDRSCVRDLATHLNISKSTVGRMIKRGQLKPHTNSIKPPLTEANRLVRLEWILDLLMGSSPWRKSRYHPMYDFVHIDEKWFKLSKKSHRYYLAKNEKGQHRTGSANTHSPKFMFTAACARPRFNLRGECYFDGRIGIFPFTTKEPAKRTSKNRAKGTMITKPIPKVTKSVTRRMLIDELIPAIKAKWPNDGTSRTIYIQQDNARPHISQNDPEWQEVYMQDGFTFILVQQPPNSPDLNVLDLGFFRSIQSLQHKKMAANVDELLKHVNEAFYELDPQTLSFVWITLQSVMNAMLKVGGSNGYDIPHMNKERLLREGRLPEILEAPRWAVLDAWEAVYGFLPPIEEELERSPQRVNEFQFMQQTTTETEQQTAAIQANLPVHSPVQEGGSKGKEVAEGYEDRLSKYGRVCPNDHEASSSKPSSK